MGESGGRGRWHLARNTEGVAGSGGNRDGPVIIESTQK